MNEELKAICEETRLVALEGNAKDSAEQLLKTIEWLIENTEDESQKQLLFWMSPIASFLCGYTRK